MLMTANLGGKILGEFLFLDTWIFVRTTFFFVPLFLMLKTSCDFFTVIRKENRENMGVIFSSIMES